MRFRAIVAVAAALSLAAGMVAFAQNAPEGVKTTQINGGVAFVSADGMTLYTFDNDTSGKSACNGRCAMIWPPLTAGADAHDMGPWTVVTRADGTKQWAYQGKPVYTFARDKAAGDAKGDNFGPKGTHVWHVARP
jgi:predicted lipoprotein with Yx(FWY)xxD motif